MNKSNIELDLRIDNPNLYRIFWRDGIGQGTKCILFHDLTKECALSMVNELNIAFPHIHHWVEANPRRN